jgi:hypothetical protein
MPYTKAHALTAGTNAEADKLDENYEDARRYINRDVVKADLGDDSVDFPEIVRGEYSNITGLHQFTFGHSWGNFINRDLRNITPLTGRAKNENLDDWPDQSTQSPTPPNEQHVVVMWQTVPNTAIQVELERSALVTYRAWIEVVIPENLTVTLNGTGQIKKHRYTTFTALRDPVLAVSVNPEPLDDTTLGRHFDETRASNTGATSWFGPPTQDPHRDTSVPDGFASNIAPLFYRRPYAITKTFELTTLAY